MKLICPAENWRHPITITPDQVSLLAEIAARLHLAYNYSASAGKVYLGRTPEAPAPSGAIRLEVPYLYQFDSATGQGSRMCYSSSCAMLVEALRPNALTGPQADDQYLRRLMGQGGDTTDASAQLRTLAHFGVRAEFSQSLTWADLDRQLEAGIPVPIGILHHGPVSRPVGGGHWITVVGRTADRGAYLVHDPAGELDLVAGGYVATNGAYLSYSKTNLGPRWMVEGPGTGWGILAERP